MNVRAARGFCSCPALHPPGGRNGDHSDRIARAESPSLSSGRDASGSERRYTFRGVTPGPAMHRARGASALRPSQTDAESASRDSSRRRRYGTPSIRRAIFQAVAQADELDPGSGSSSFSQDQPGRNPVASSVEVHVYPGNAAERQAYIVGTPGGGPNLTEGNRGGPHRPQPRRSARQLLWVRPSCG